VNVVTPAAGGYFAFSANNGNDTAVGLFIYVDAESAGLAYRECSVGRVNFVQISLTEFANAEIDGTFRETHLRNILIQV
jgi:hypothetical protein